MSPKILEFPGQKDSQVEQETIGELYGGLTEMLDSLRGFDDTALKGRGLARNELGSPNTLELWQGGDGIENHKANLHIPPNSTEGGDHRTYISANILNPRKLVNPDGTVSTEHRLNMILVRSGGENPQRFVLGVCNDGHVQGAPSCDDDPWKELPGCRHLSKEDAEDLAWRIIATFDEERKLREAALLGGAQEAAS